MQCARPGDHRRRGDRRRAAIGRGHGDRITSRPDDLVGRSGNGEVPGVTTPWGQADRRQRSRLSGDTLDGHAGSGLSQQLAGTQDLTRRPRRMTPPARSPAPSIRQFLEIWSPFSQNTPLSGAPDYRGVVGKRQWPMMTSGDIGELARSTRRASLVVRPACPSLLLACSKARGARRHLHVRRSGRRPMTNRGVASAYCRGLSLYRTDARNPVGPGKRDAPLRPPRPSVPPGLPAPGCGHATCRTLARAFASPASRLRRPTLRRTGSAERRTTPLDPRLAREVQDRRARPWHVPSRLPA